MAKRTSVTATNAPHHGLRKFWRSGRANKKKMEKWVDDKTHFGSVPVFLRAGSPDLYQKIISDLKIPNL
jgi:hypothetical protein